MIDSIAVARDILRRGIMPVPIPPKEKSPTHRAWQKLVITDDNIAKYFRANFNVGGLMGPASNGLADVDLDCPEAIALAPSLLPTMKSIYGRAGKRESHFLYTCLNPEPK